MRHLSSVAYCSLVALLLVVGPAEAQDRRGPFNAETRSVRTREIDQQHIRLEMKVDLDKQEFQSRATLTVSPYKSISSIALDAAEMRIERVAVGAALDQVVKHELKGGSLHVPLDREYKPGDQLKIQVDYFVAKPRQGAHFVAPDAREPDQPRMMWTQCEPEEARFWYPCIDSPADRITSETIVTAAKPYFVLSNGVLKGKNANADGTVTWHWVQEKSHVPYLISVVVGDFEAYEQSWDGIPVTSYVPRGQLSLAKPSFEKTAKMMEFFSRKIGYRYPWPKYAQICVDEYQWGGMEHTTATTLNLETLHDERAHLDVSSDGLVAHELAHQWWGDVVTCKDWGELWLNESFASYFDTLWAEEDRGADEATWDRYNEAQGYIGEDKTIRRSIVNYRYDSPMHMFDGHSYPKGSRVLHMLRFELGDELFWRAINRYIQINQFRVVETADFRSAIEESTGQGMNWFFDQWLYHGGHPDFNVDWSWDEATKTVKVVVKQTQKVDSVTPLFRSTVEVEIANGSTTQMRRIQVSKAEETFHFQMNQRPSRVCFDPRDWVLKTLKFEKSREELLDQLANSPHLIARHQAVQGLKALPESDAEINAALSRTATSDTFWAVREEAVRALARGSSDEIRKTLLRLAATDSSSKVRRAALSSLGNFAHDDVRAALRTSIKNDQSYYAIAEAVRALVRVDRDRCEADLLAALELPSHRDVIMQAAVDGLVELKSNAGADRMIAKLPGKLSPQQRVMMIAALSKLRPDDSRYVTELRETLTNERNSVRRAAINTLADHGPPQSLEWLQAQRGKESNRGMIEAVDKGIEKLRSRAKDSDQLRKELDDLRRLNQKLEERLKKLEQK